MEIDSGEFERYNFKLLLMKKVLTLVSITALLATLGAPTAAASFKDVANTHVNNDAIEYMKTNKIVQGYPDGSYQPDRPINRVEFSKIIVGAYFKEDTIKKCDTSILKFTDTVTNDWYSPFLCVAVKEGIIEGYPDKTFKKDKAILFTEAAKIISIANSKKTIKDPIWYKPYIEDLETKKAIPDTIGRFDHAITRGEMAEMTYRLKAKITNKSSGTYKVLESHSKLPKANFDKNTAKVGDKVGGMKVSKVEKTQDVITLTFSGKTTVKGTYTHHDGKKEPLVAGKICMTNLDAASEVKMPKVNGARTSFFCFINKKEAEKEFGATGSTGTATVEIDELIIPLPTAGDPINTVKLIKVISKQPKTTNNNSNSGAGNGGLIHNPNSNTIIGAQPTNNNVLALSLSVEKAKAGDQSNNWTVKSVTPLTGNTVKKDNASILFEGSAIIEGQYVYYPKNHSALPDLVCMGNFTDDSKKKLPWVAGKDLASTVICFSNAEFAKAEMGTNSNIRQTRVEIKNLVYNFGSPEGVEEAELVKVDYTSDLIKALDPVLLEAKPDAQLLPGPSLKSNDGQGIKPQVNP